ncbi:hypothetical protein DRO60_03755 [Candidatus Bathyarchaeota archaeon]|nr:MAG: hypothetical protein DRO60_03755 [Candidatus Bathyarchaeota archaeon]
MRALLKGRLAMSEVERPAGLAIMEKLVGLVLLVMGILTIYYTGSAIPSLGPIWPLFVAFGALLLLVGLALLLARAR